MRCLLPILLGVCLAVFPARGKEPPDPIDREVTVSLKHDPSTHGQIRAFRHARERWEAEMAAILERLRKKLPPAQRVLLEHSQNDWTLYRDSDQEMRNSFNSGRRGTLIGIMATEANMLAVRARVQTLQGYERRITPAE